MNLFAEPPTDAGIGPVDGKPDQLHGYFVFSSNEDHLQHRVRRLLKGEIPSPPDAKLFKWAPEIIQFESTAETVVVAVELNQR